MSMKLRIVSDDRDHAILVGDEDNNDISEFYHSDHATVSQSYETALALAKQLVAGCGDHAQRQPGRLARYESAMAADRTSLTQVEIRNLFKRHGGGFHGPRVGHANIEEQAFYRFIAELVLNERRAAIDAALSAISSTSERTYTIAEAKEALEGAIEQLKTAYSLPSTNCEGK